MIFKPTCVFWFFASCLFAALFAWAAVSENDLETQCVHIKLVENETADAVGYFKNGIECVYQHKLSDACRPYYKHVPNCPNSRRLVRTDQDVRFIIDRFEPVIAYNSLGEE